jgi:glycosyltransferase involved in cell wall biosynthesis
VADRTLLVVSQRPLELGGGGSVRWQHLLRVLPHHGWRVVECSPPIGATANDAGTDARTARLAARRAQVMAVAGRLVDPVARAIGVKPEAFAPNNLWALTGRPAVRAAVERERPDVVVATVPPPSAMLAAAATVGDVPFVAELRDLWAGSPYFDRGGRLLPALEGRALRHAAAIVTVTGGFRDRLLALHPELAPRLHLLPNGFDPKLLAERRPPTPLDGRPARFIHAGALYGDRTAIALLTALERPELRDRVRLELVGVVDPETRRAHESAREIDVTIEPPESWETAIERTLAADVAVVINTPGTGGDIGQVPGKVYEVLALGRPVLALMRPGSEAARLLERFGQGTGLAPPDDPSAIAAAIERLLADPPPPVPPEALADFDRDRIAARYGELLDEVATRSRSATSSGTTFSRR